MSLLKVSSLAIAATMFAGSAFAADLIVADPVVDMASPKAYDVYVGILGGVGNQTNQPVFAGLGVTIGADVDLTDVVFVGAELRGTAYWNNTGFSSWEVLGFGRLGFHATDAVDLYVMGGAAYSVTSANVASNYYGFGAGAEFAVADDMSLRTEVSAYGDWGVAPDTLQGTVGLLWQIK
jgi:hypothetical protein